MPFTPLHVAPALALKSIGKPKFSLLIFALAQVLMDLQPLVVILTGRGQLHGITHTLLLSVPIGACAAVAGRPFARWLIRRFGKDRQNPDWLSWKNALWSGLAGSVSHVLLDAFIYTDLQPFWPLSTSNPLVTGRVTDTGLRIFLLFLGMAGLIVWGVSVAVNWLKQR